jgi:hypothetical protein
VRDVVPEATARPFGDALALAGVTQVLAGESGGEDVDGLDGGPVGGGDVVVVGDVGPVVGEDQRGVAVVLAEPGGFGVEDGGDGELEAAVAGAEGADARGHDVSRKR